PTPSIFRSTLFPYTTLFRSANQLRLAIIVSALILLIFFAAIILFLLQYYKRKIMHEKEKTEMEEIHRTELLNTQLDVQQQTMRQDRKSTRLNSSHVKISYAV